MTQGVGKLGGALTGLGLESLPSLRGFDTHKINFLPAVRGPRGGRAPGHPSGIYYLIHTNNWRVQGLALFSGRSFITENEVNEWKMRRRNWEF